MVYWGNIKTPRDATEDFANDFKGLCQPFNKKTMDLKIMIRKMANV